MKTSIRSLTGGLRTALLLLLFGTGLAGCAPSTQITGSWKSPNATSQTYDKIIVAALTDDVQARQVIENNLQAQLQKQGINATKSIDVFPPALMRESGSDTDMLMNRIKGDGYDAIMTAAVIDQETETQYVPGSYAYAPVTRFGWYGNFRGYYNYLYPTLYQPGYYDKDKVYYLETNLYDAQSENLLWSAQSKSYSPASLSTFADTFAEITVDKMKQDNLIQ